MTALQLQQDGKLYLLPEYPEKEPKRWEPGDSLSYNEAAWMYHKEKIEHSKSNAILVKNEMETMRSLLTHYGISSGESQEEIYPRFHRSFKPDTVYFLEGYEAEIIEYVKETNYCTAHITVDYRPHRILLALIKPQSIKQ